MVSKVATSRFDEDDLLPISALQHLAFCPRQCALIHIEQAWAENRLTAEGRVMDDDTRKAVLVAYQKRKQEEIQHPFIDESVEIGLLPHVQALLLGRHLRGDLDGYPPFFWK